MHVLHSRVCLVKMLPINRHLVTLSRHGLSYDMAAENWLKPNHRAIGLGFLVPGFLCVLACLLVLLLPTSGTWGWLRWVLAVPALVLATVIALSLGYHLCQPRLSCQGDELWVYLSGANPIRVPLTIVECFFLGQTEFEDGPGRGGVDAKNIVVRLAEKAEDWHHRDVRRNLGNWCGGYITVKGGWCEPITPDLMRELNRRLGEKHRAMKEASSTETASEASSTNAK